MVLIWNEALDSWGGDDQWYGFKMWYVWGINLRGWYESANM